MLAKALSAATAAGEKLYIEDTFSTWLYTGNGSTQTITNGIDLAGEGGLVWTKARSTSINHAWYDTARGGAAWISSSSSLAQLPYDDITFSNTGYSVANISTATNVSNVTYASWTFRKAPGFFDVVTYTGTGANRTVSHNLGSVPGCIIVKRTDNTGDWQVYHRSLANTEYLVLNSAAAKATGTTRWNSTTPTSTVFSLGTDATVNASGGTYVAYLFAHDAGGFGDSGNESVVKCGSFTTNGSGNATVNLGWEPQWILVKQSAAESSWLVFDSMRGWAHGNDSLLQANLSAAEANSLEYGEPTATGFNFKWSVNAPCIYIAIRRGPMKTPTDATKVFIPVATSADPITTGFPVDLNIIHYTGANVSNHWFSTRLIGQKFLATNSTDTEADGSSYIKFDSNTRFSLTNWYGGNPVIHWNFRRAPGFFDVVAYTGDGVPGRYVNHGLAAAPEMIITKCRNSSGGNWVSTHKDLNNYRRHIYLNSNSEQFPIQDFYTDVTSSSYRVWKVNGQGVDANNAGGENYIAYLFASCPGASKVGSYTGNGSSQTINCGFTAGSRFVLIKRTDSTGNWLVADTARGIVSGNDPLLYLNSTAAEITTLDWIDPDSSGFIVNQEATANANVNGATYIYLSVA